MTLEQAKLILRTYTLPMTDEQLKQFKKALALVSGFWGKPPGGV